MGCKMNAEPLSLLSGMEDMGMLTCLKRPKEVEYSHSEERNVEAFEDLPFRTLGFWERQGIFHQIPCCSVEFRDCMHNWKFLPKWDSKPKFRLNSNLPSPSTNFSMELALFIPASYKLSLGLEIRSIYNVQQAMSSKLTLVWLFRLLCVYWQKLIGSAHDFECHNFRVLDLRYKAFIQTSEPISG